MRFSCLLFLSFGFLLFSCKEVEIPAPQNPLPGNVLEVQIKFSSAAYENGKLRIQASVNSKDGYIVQKRGVAFGPLSLPRLGKDSVEMAGSGFGDFTLRFSPTDYASDVFVRAFAISLSSTGKTDTTYGNQVLLQPYHRLKSLSLNALFTDSIRVNWNGLSLCKIPGLESMLSKGICWSKSRGGKPLAGNFVTSTTTDTLGMQVFAASLEPGTLYFFRAFAVNAADTVFGPEFGCSTGLTDAEANFYPTVYIGNQIWMASNLRSTRFTVTGTDSLENVTDNARWDTIAAPAFASSADNNVFGRYYNHYAITSSRQLCPAGWKMPDRNDWDTLFSNLGGWETAGLALKAGTTAWGASIGEGQGSSKFNALPAGKKSGSGEIVLSGKLGFWWMKSSSVAPGGFRITNLDKGVFYDTYQAKEGLSVRCLKQP
jgi:uncharacterized protein (TIGR02145 family)